jgi:hypothetical protein
MTHLTRTLLGVFLTASIAHAAGPATPALIAPTTITIRCPAGPFSAFVPNNQLPPNWSYFGGLYGFVLVKADTAVQDGKQSLQCHYSSGAASMTLGTHVPLDSCRVTPGTTDFVCKPGTVPGL